MSQRGILVIAENLHLSEAEADALLGMAKRGNKILLAASYFDRILRDRLEFESSYFDFNPEVLKKYVTFLSARDSLHWIGDPAVYPRQTFYFYPQLCYTYFCPVPLAMNRLAEKTARIDKSRYETEMDSTTPDTICQVSVAMSCPWGKGEILLVSTPLLFTNYGALDIDNATYIFRLLSHIGGLPIVRTEAYMKKTVQMQASPFNYFLSQRPFRWALYLTMISVLLFMIFTARRRQRAIPVIREPENKSLEFTELIGTLYYQKKEHAILVRKKYAYFAEELRREIQVDVDEVANDERSFSRIAQKTGMIEEVPGVAKTLLAHLVACLIDADFSRIQFTPDLMPGDVLGTTVFNMKTNEFDFHRGPIFADVILVDEINRAPAKTQAALFEVMEERQVSIDGATYRMGDLYTILATQNAVEQEGTILR